MALFTLSEFAAYLQRDFSAEDAATAQLMHDLTEGRIEAEAGDLLADPLQAGVKAIALKVAARGMGNARGVVSEATGGVSTTYQSSVPHGIYLTAAERDELAEAVGRSRAYTLRLAHRRERTRAVGRTDTIAYDAEVYP